MLIVFLLFLIGIFIYKYIFPTYSTTYSLKGDYVPSIGSVLKTTKWVSKYEKNTKNNIYLKKYTYQKQNNVVEDLKKYSNYLIKMEQFEVLKDFDLDDPFNTTILLGKKSHIDFEKIIVVEISYTKDTITISLVKKKGSFLK